MKIALGVDAAEELADLQRRVEALEQQMAATIALDARVASVEAHLSVGRAAAATASEHAEKRAASLAEPTTPSARTQSIVPGMTGTITRDADASELDEDADKLVVGRGAAAMASEHTEKRAASLSELTTTPSARTQGIVPGMTGTITHDVDASELGEDADKLVAHKLNESIYEVAVLIWMPMISRRSGMLAALALFLNVVIELLFVVVIYLAFLEPQLPSVESVRRWRVMEGHLLSNMGVDGTALASRVCHNDPSLIVSTDKQRLLQSLSVYTHALSGATLAVIVILMWFLTVSQEVEQAVSFLVAVCSQKTERTHVQRRRGATTLCAVSLSRKVWMVLVSVVRVVMDLLLLIEGALWLSVQVNVVDLVLNAAALAFILDLDDTLFKVFVTWPLKVLLSEIEPLPKVHWKQRGPGFWPLINVLGSASFVFAFAYLKVAPLARDMEAVKEAMCSEPQDWVYSAHDSGVVLGATSLPFVEGGRPALFADLQRVLEEGTLASAGTVQVLSSMATMHGFVKSSTGDLALEMTGIVMGNACTDYDFGAPHALKHIAATLRRVLGNNSLTSCAEVWPFCDGNAFVTKIVCPETCGCSLPRSGLYGAGPNRGCPQAECHSAPQWKEALASIPCRDEDLCESAEWRRFWTQWEENNAKVSPSKEVYYRTAARAMQERSCAGGSSLEPGELHQLCGPSDILGSISAFCPVLCNCSARRYPTCPPACWLG